MTLSLILRTTISKRNWRLWKTLLLRNKTEVERYETIVNTIKFHIPRPDLEALRTKVSKSGFQIWGDSGSTSYHGVSVTYVYQEPILTITVTKTSFLMSTYFALGKIKEWTGLEPIEEKKT
jgi:hypothetical protein